MTHCRLATHTLVKDFTKLTGHGRAKVKHEFNVKT